MCICILLAIVYQSYRKNGNIWKTKKEPIKEETLVPPNNNNSLTSIVTTLLNKENYRYTVCNEGRQFQLGFKNGFDDTPFETFIEISDNSRYIEFTSIVYRDIPDDSLTKSIEVITRLNQNYVLGHYNFLFEERIVLFKAFYILDTKKTFSEELFFDHFEYVNRAPKYCKKILHDVINNNEEPILAIMNNYGQQ